MGMTEGLYSSHRGDWATPQSLFDDLTAEFGITFDVCATHENAKAAIYYTPDQDALNRPWPRQRVCYMNPPYGRTIGQWVAKARRESELGTTVVCLLPARTDTAWWQDNIENEQGERKASLVRFLRGRVHFDNAGPAPFPSAVVVFKP